MSELQQRTPRYLTKGIACRGRRVRRTAFVLLKIAKEAMAAEHLVYAVAPLTYV